MKTLILNSFDNQGGAAIATYRLHKGLASISVDSQMLVQIGKSRDPRVITPLNRWQKVVALLRPHLDELATRFYAKKKPVLFSSAWVPDGIASRVGELNPDIVHLFWVNAGFLRAETIRKLKRPIVWTLHDMWPFTGGCHYDEECGRFRQSCGQCPILGSKSEKDLSRRVWQRKKDAWSGTPIVVVATSRWLGEMAAASSLFANQRIEVIPNGIDTSVYKPADKALARDTYNLPRDRQLILFSAFDATSDKRKGSQYLLAALKILVQQGWDKTAELVVIGASSMDSGELGMDAHFIGNLHDEISQVLLYSAADVVVAPSVQENLSNTVIESLACGTPVVAFDIGGMPDMIDHKKSGYLAKPFEAEDLAEGIAWCLGDDARQQELSACARQTVEDRYELSAVASRYRDLYEDILK